MLQNKTWKQFILFLIMTVSASYVCGQSNNSFDNFFAVFTDDCTFQSSQCDDNIVKKNGIVNVNKFQVPLNINRY